MSAKPTDRVHLKFSSDRPAAPGWVLTLDTVLSIVEPAKVTSGGGGTLFLSRFGGSVVPLSTVEFLLYAPLNLLERSNFSRVSHLFECFDKPSGDMEAINWQMVIDQLKVVQEEVAELTEGIEARCLGDIRDAVCDVLVTAYGVGHLLGQPVDEDMKIVDESNLSKLCKDGEELDATLTHYREKIGIDVYSGGSPGALWVKSSRDQTGLDGRSYSANKFLKCVYWHAPLFSISQRPGYVTPLEGL